MLQIGPDSAATYASSVQVEGPATPGACLCCRTSWPSLALHRRLRSTGRHTWQCRCASLCEGMPRKVESCDVGRDKEGYLCCRDGVHSNHLLGDSGTFTSNTYLSSVQRHSPGSQKWCGLWCNLSNAWLVRSPSFIIWRQHRVHQPGWAKSCSSTAFWCFLISHP